LTGHLPGGIAALDNGPRWRCERWAGPRRNSLRYTNLRNLDVGRAFGTVARRFLTLPSGKRRSKKGDQVIEKKAK